MNYEGDNIYGNVSNGFHMSQFEYDSLRIRSVSGLAEQEPQPQKIYSFAGVNQSLGGGTVAKPASPKH